MDTTIVDIGESNAYKLAAARALMAAFADRERSAWPDIERAAEEVEECAEGANLCIGAYDGRTMLRITSYNVCYTKLLRSTCTQCDHGC